MNGNGEPGSVRILCVVAKPLGDSVCILPEIRWLAEKHGTPVDVLVKTTLQVELYQGLEYIRMVTRLTHWRLPYWISSDQQRLVREMKKADYRHIYLFFETDLPKKNKFHMLLRRAGIPASRAIFGFPEADKPLFLAQDCPHPALRFSPILKPTENEKDVMRARLRSECGWRGEPVVLVHPGCSLRAKGITGSKLDNARNWPVANWVSVIKGVFAKLPGAKVILTGTNNERRITGRIKSTCADRAFDGDLYDWANRLTLRELISLQAIAHSCLSIDTGPLHSALAVGCPVLGLYDKKDPRFMGRCCPRGWGPCLTIRGFPEYGSKVNGVSYIARIRPETVLRLWSELPERVSSPEAAQGWVRHHFEGEKDEDVRPWQEHGIFFHDS
jgi:ADP-heptose:LPS heptosyltransferase